MPIRELNGKDLRTVAAIVAKNAKAFALMKRKEGEGDDDYRARVGQEVFAALIANSLEEVWALVADIGQMSKDELDAAPISTPLEIVAAVMASQGAADFFGRASGMVSGATSEETSTE